MLVVPAGRLECGEDRRFFRLTDPKIVLLSPLLFSPEQKKRRSSPHSKRVSHSLLFSF
jgi:hypothetical protein